MSAADLLGEEPEPLDWVWDRFLPAGALVLLVAFMKVGKSTFAYPLVLAIAQGRPFLGYSTESGPVLILAVEEHPRDVRRRLERFGLRPDDPVYVHRGRLSPADLPAIRAFIVAHGIKVALLDTLSRYWDIERENDNAEVVRRISPFLDLAHETGTVVILVHHERKSGGEEGRGIRGGSALFSSVGQALLLERRQGGGDSQRVLKTVGRYDDSPHEVIVDLRGDEYICLGTPEDTGRAGLANRVWDALDEIPRTVEVLAQRAGVTVVQARRALDSLLIGDVITKHGKGVRGDPYTFCRVARNSIRPQSTPEGDETNSASTLSRSSDDA